MAISLTLFCGSPNAHNGAAASLGFDCPRKPKIKRDCIRPVRVSLTAVLFLTSLAPCATDPAPAIHYAPGENLEHVDVAPIDRAEHEIDMAAYVLTDWPVMQALTRAADRGVKVRIYLDGSHLAERKPTKVFNDLAETPDALYPGRNKRRGRQCSRIWHEGPQLEETAVTTG